MVQVDQRDDPTLLKTIPFPGDDPIEEFTGSLKVFKLVQDQSQVAMASPRSQMIYSQKSGNLIWV